MDAATPSKGLRPTGPMPLATGIPLGSHFQHRDAAERCLAVLLPAAAVLAIVLASTAVLVSTTNAWNDIRLAPSVGLLHGYPVYSLPGKGPMNGHIPTYLWLADGSETARRWVLALGVVGTCSLVVVSLLVDVPAMLYCTLAVPAEHELRFGLARVLSDLVPRLAPPTATIGSLLPASQP